MKWQELIANKSKYVGGLLQGEESYDCKYVNTIVDIYERNNILCFELDDGQAISISTDYFWSSVAPNGVLHFNLIYVGSYTLYPKES